ncbi:hypothetical protein NM688_g7288 [Phlebia brevispora]|uniref:Uncharacterized protein n=1 Tax=Phlebia brevispora TaxID=194682 RepID=A0ACC1S735_9APHY|nr:hypothetical protein NM688_g7288 [Phlebia brevispora]
MNFTTFLVQISDALQHKKGQELAYLLSPREPHSKSLVKEFRNPTRQSLSYYEQSMESPWDEIAIQYVLVVNHCGKNRATEAFTEQCTLVNLFLRYFSSNSGWTLPVLFSILRDLRDLASDADLQASQNGHGGTANMEEAARVISKAFTSCVTDRQSPYAESRKWGVYYVVGLILKSYFRLTQSRIKYYLGMLEFLNEDYAKSEQEFTLAFYACHTDARKNQERILAYLIPLRILRGHLPSRELLNEFPVLDDLFSPFVAAIKKGDISTYDRLLEQHERRLVEMNLLLTLERGRELCLRCLFRRVWVVSDKSTRIPVSLFHSALRIAGMDVPSDEAECLVANMIYRGFIRGYISHEKQMVVLANKNAFPRIADCPAPYATL